MKEVSLKIFVKIHTFNNVCWLEFCSFTKNAVSSTSDVFKFNSFSQIFSLTLVIFFTQRPHFLKIQRTCYFRSIGIYLLGLAGSIKRESSFSLAGYTLTATARPIQLSYQLVSQIYFATYFEIFEHFTKLFCKTYSQVLSSQIHKLQPAVYSQL